MITLTDEDIDRLAAAVVTRQRALQRAILTLEEAVLYTGHESSSAFYRWAERYGVTAVTHGRYSRRWLDRGLEKEAAQGRRRRTAGEKEAA